MAASAATVTVKAVDTGGFGNRTRSYGTITFSASYQAGGDYVTPALMGLDILSALILSPATVTTGSTTAYIPAVNKTTALPATGVNQVLIQMFESAGSAAALTEATGNLSTYSCYFMAMGD